ncbi:SDR family NAD(P)-dependent oxidoreductase [Ferrimonas marina]|uniref:NAD(P)-dependent dehydrogenase, short-chain alcohol dehydrogenase family n=1 Tax=Ferrimonas marina TaxID=299255 RepID=A0A1M5MYL2_9GAMM|nr:SDR family NAD(P)-dependent oxidoreductase [Ferrimonas marina]SHG82388.1 NAD(P)-dependent dehydrogenase, short-chain alcohol dehydrogenase family [Ferrimonas marina]
MRPHAWVVGASGGLGRATVEALVASGRFEQVVAVSRQRPAGEVTDSAQTAVRYRLCDHSEQQIAQLADSEKDSLAHTTHLVICNGILHRPELQPEKRLEQWSWDAMAQVMAVNLGVPLGYLQQLLPRLPSKAHTSLPTYQFGVVAVLSARVGSIGDNGLGGWYSYRASKAALNMALQTAAVEWGRRNPSLKLMAFHPGTVETPLSEPFRTNLAPGQLRQPSEVAQGLVALMGRQRPDGQLSYLDWRGDTIPW